MNIPKVLRDLPQWVLWKHVVRGGKPTKVPFQVSGVPAEANEPDTWTTFEAIENQLANYEGPGFEFSAKDPFCGIDLDGCRDPQTGRVADWAREIILSINSYAEVSPSQMGVKIFIRAEMPHGAGRTQRKIPGAERICAKMPGIEIYDRGRYFAVTGLQLVGPSEPQSRQLELDALLRKYFAAPPIPPGSDFRSASAVIERARQYLAKLPPAISGQGGHNQTFRAACVAVLGFGLTEQESLQALNEWNQACDPAWSERELMHKIQDAGRQGGERNYLRNVSPERWESIQVPSYKAPLPKPEPKITILADAAKQYLEVLKSGGTSLIELGLPDVDYAIGGGIEPGELIILAARPSHGKSAVALQIVHHWTKNKTPCLIISEEMSALALGKRAIQFISETPQEHWKTQHQDVSEDLEFYADHHAHAIIVESCGTTENVVEQIDKAVSEHKIGGVVVDYAQLLRNAGKTRYEQVTNTSIMLTAAARRHRIPLVLLCQLSRDIEGRAKFVPQMADLKESGQLEQDADVIMFLVWPHRIEPKQPAAEYMFYVAKNRNRPINQNVVKQRFVPSRQTIMPEKLIPVKRFNEFDTYNDQAAEFDSP